KSGADGAASVWPGTPIGRVAAPLRDQVLDVLRQAILDFKLRPGQRLIERELMEQLGVSRATVREVVGRLTSEGLLTTIPQKGTIVAVLSIREAADIYAMRASLEALAARQFVERSSPHQVKALREAFEAFVQIDEAGEAGDLARLRAKDAFYKVLLEGADNVPLTQTLTGLQSRVRLLRRTSLSVQGRINSTIEEIRKVVEAIEAGDGAAAAEASADRVRNAAAAALARMEQTEQQQVA